MVTIVIMIKLTDRLDAKLGHDSSFMIQTLFRSRKLFLCMEIYQLFLHTCKFKTK